MININTKVQIDEKEIHLDLIRSSGPGGQNVNKVSTAVQLRFDIRNSPSLSDEVKQRLIRLAGNRVTGDGILVIDAHRYRTQEQNRADARERLTELVREAAEPPKFRVKTKPTKAAKERRLKAKTKRGTIKKLRREKPSYD